MNAKISAFVIRVEEIIHLLLYNLHECKTLSLMNGKLKYLKNTINTYVHRRD